jgi:hypothetical protein
MAKSKFGGGGVLTLSNVKFSMAEQSILDPFHQQENEPDLAFRGITNSGDVQDSIWLVCLKNIFSKQVRVNRLPSVYETLYDHLRVQPAAMCPS